MSLVGDIAFLALVNVLGEGRRRSPSPMEVERGHIHISQRRTRRRRHTCVTGGVGLGRSRGSIRVRRGRGGEVAPTENVRTSDEPSHSPLLMNEAVPAPQNVRRAAGSSAQPRILCGSTLERTQQVIKLSLPATVSIVCHRTRH